MRRSLLIYGAAGFLPGATPWPERLIRWATVFGVLLLPTLLTVAVTAMASRRKVALPEAAND